MLQGQQQKLTYALNKEGILVHVDSVPNGNGCGCICPCCKNELCAKNGGEERIHHFAHLGGADCSGGIESALHLMAKNILQEVKSVRLPAIENICKSELLHFDEVDVEVYDEGTSLRPDCIGRYGDKIIWIEFKRTHAVDKKKKGKIISKRIDCIEIDLKGCDLTPEKVKDLLLNQKEKRIWIYNSEHQFSYSKKAKSGIQDKYYNEDYYHEERDDYYDYWVERTFAFDENNQLVHLDKIEEIDMDAYNYFCLGCGKEVGINVNSDGSYFFTHIDEDVDCNDENYLIEAAKSILYDNFYSAEKFEIAIDQTHVCRNYLDCKLYLEGECCTSKPEVFDLKTLGYNRCEKNKTVQETNFHLFLSRQGEADSGIGVIIKSRDNDIIVSSSLRLIEVTVNHANDLSKLRCSCLKESYLCKTNNFKYKRYSDGEPFNIVRKIPKFILYSSGKPFAINVKFKCGDVLNSRSSNAVVLHLANCEWDDISYDNAISLGLIYCYKRGLNACYCYICNCLNAKLNKPVCMCYRNKPTPHYPLEEIPINCQYFVMNQRLKEHLEDEYGMVKIIE
ncbi:MAG: hypothetical protein IKJ92_07255 [Bacteroidaceae bacterium]|nr:hypothetical protein [Bacteroidaceae bacterium]